MKNYAGMLFMIVVVGVILVCWTMSAEKPVVVPVPSEKVLEVVGKACTSYDAIGSGSTGFIVRDGGSLRFVTFDAKSHFDTAPAPKYVIEITFANGKKVYSDLQMLK